MKNLPISICSLFLMLFIANCATEDKNESLVRIDKLCTELNRTNQILEKEIGLNYDYYFQAKNYDSLKYGGIIRELDFVYLKVIEQAGGFEPESPVLTLFDPSNTESIKRLYEDTNLFASFRKELKSAIDLESNQFIKAELERIKNDVFNTDLPNSTAVEFRLRCILTKNRLYLLEQMV